MIFEIETSDHEKQLHMLVTDQGVTIHKLLSSSCNSEFGVY